MFLWRNKLNYPRIITKYSSLTIPLLHVSGLWTELKQKGGILAIPFKRHQILAHWNKSILFVLEDFNEKRGNPQKWGNSQPWNISAYETNPNALTFRGGNSVKKKMPTFWNLVYTKGKNLLLCGSKFFPFRLDPFLEANWGEQMQTVCHKIVFLPTY